MLTKTADNFTNFQIPARRTIGSSRVVPNSLLSFLQPGSLLPPTRYDVGYDPTNLCGFFHSLTNMSGRHGADGYALARFFSFLYVPLSVCGAHNLPWKGMYSPSHDTHFLVDVSRPFTRLFTMNVIGLICIACH